MPYPGILFQRRRVTRTAPHTQKSLQAPGAAVLTGRSIVYYYSVCQVTAPSLESV